MVTSVLRPHELQPWRSKVLRTATLAAVTLLFLPGLKAQDKYEQQMESHTTVKVLPNGLTLVLSERHEAPVFSFYTLVDAGSADDPGGQSGLAHMFEHIAFKGTTEVGTTNYAAEKLALDRVEKAYAAYDAEYRKRVGQDPAKLASLKKSFDDEVEAAQK